jgi:hypothetical protein
MVSDHQRLSPALRVLVVLLAVGLVVPVQAAPCLYTQHHLAPAGLGRFSHRLLVGSFGDGRIHAFEVATGRLGGPMRGTDGHPLIIDGL